MKTELALPRVLVVDDDVANLQTFRRVFCRRYRVLLAASGHETLALIASCEADVAFIDYMMPRMNGAALAHELHLVAPHIACYMLTGYSDLAEIAQLRAEGSVTGVLSKPWERADIERAVDAVLGAPPRHP